jgi:ketosteroid isomerase-like protein
MSQDNVELMREWNEAFNRRDLDAWLALMDPNIEITSSFMGGELHGHEGACEWLLELEGTIPDLRVEIREIQDLGDVLLVGVSMRGRGIGSDAPFEQSPWVATEWRDRKCVRSRGFSTKAEALEAVGLRE